MYWICFFWRVGSGYFSFVSESVKKINWILRPDYFRAKSLKIICNLLNIFVCILVWYHNFFFSRRGEIRTCDRSKSIRLCWTNLSPPPNWPPSTLPPSHSSRTSDSSCRRARSVYTHAARQSCNLILADFLFQYFGYNCYFYP